MEPGSIVEFFEEKRILCGVVLELKGERLHVLAQTSRELTLPPKRLLHAGPSLPLDRLNRQELLKRLEETARKREALKAAINLEDLWELLAQENHPSTVAELAELWFGRAAADEVAATGRCLREDRFLFKHKDDQVIPNPPELVAQLQEQHERELARRREMEEIGAWLQAVWEGRELDAQPPWRDRVVALLRRMAVFGAEAPDYAQGKAYLDKARLHAADAPFRLLVRLGVFQEDEDLDLYRLEVPLEFAAEALAQARQLSRHRPGRPLCGPAPGPDRSGDSSPSTGSAPGTSTTPSAWRKLPEGWRLGIHISDVSAMVLPDSPLDREAQERATSIYLPERRLPMLPEEISEDLLSLLAHQERLALSFLVTLSPAGRGAGLGHRPQPHQGGPPADLPRSGWAPGAGNRTLTALARLTERLKAAAPGPGRLRTEAARGLGHFHPPGRVAGVGGGPGDPEPAVGGRGHGAGQLPGGPVSGGARHPRDLPQPAGAPGAHPPGGAQEPAGIMAGPAASQPGGDGPGAAAPLGPGPGLLHPGHFAHPPLPGPPDPPAAPGGRERGPARLTAGRIWSRSCRSSSRPCAGPGSSRPGGCATGS